MSVLHCTVQLLLWVPLLFFVGFLLPLYIWIQAIAKRRLPHLKQSNKGEVTPVVGFFHPYCNAGGGGERVLWVAVRAMQLRYQDIKCVIYTGDTDVTSEKILQKARQRFNIVIPNPGNVHFVFLKRRGWVEASRYPFLTLLGQSLGSMILGLEAILSFVPDVYIDTMSYAFTLPIFRYLGGCRVGCYVHYPTISTDMLRRVSQRTETYNNASFISRSPVLSKIKLLYYHAFAKLYGLMGRQAQTVMVNSSWTYGHISNLWKVDSKTFIVYPPCDVTEFIKIPLLDDKNRESKIILSIAQFRPEKDHPLQVRSFHKFLSSLKDSEKKGYKLLLVGSCRNEEDLKRVEDLKTLCEELNIGDYVDFELNVSFDRLKELMSQSVIGLHTMWNEHFGIGVVELMAAGTIILAHNSGGPKLDIVLPVHNHKTGFLAHNVDTYADAMEVIFNMSASERLEIRKHARESVGRFSEKEFETGFLSAVDPLMH